MLVSVIGGCVVVVVDGWVVVVVDGWSWWWSTASLGRR